MTQLIEKIYNTEAFILLEHVGYHLGAPNYICLNKVNFPNRSSNV